MCLLLAAHRVHPRFDLVVAANRDELHARPSAPAHFWHDVPGMLAGRDLSAGGTWLGVDGSGRFAAVTNFHETPTTTNPPSRGELVTGYLRGPGSAQQYVRALERRAANYAGFNLLVADRDELWYASNREADFARLLPPGIYGLSNHLLDTAWPKTIRARRALAQWVEAGGTTLEPLRTLLRDPEPELQSGLPWPASSGPFVTGAEFGTRCSTWLAREGDLLQLGEENFTARGESASLARFSVSLR
jgi:uncharacterized protein with NRDE domain